MEEEQDVATPETPVADPQAIEPQSEAADAPEQDPQTTEEPEQTPSEPKQSRESKRRQRAREVAEAKDREIAQLRRKLEETSAIVDGIKDPSEADFENPDEYLAVKAATTVSRQGHAVQVEQAQRRLKEVEEQKVEAAKQAWAEQAVEARQRYPDFAEVAYAAPISDGVAKMLPEMENGADVAYFLGSNPEKATALSSMNPTQAAMELGKISAQISAPKPRVKSNTPKPIEPITAKAAGGEKSLMNMSPSEVLSWLKANER